MIRKLGNGQYRLYSRKLDPKTGKRRNLGTFDSREKASRTSVKSSTSSGTDQPDRGGGRASSTASSGVPGPCHADPPPYVGDRDRPFGG